MRPLVQHERLMWVLLATGSVGAIALAPIAAWRPFGLFVLLLGLVTAADLFGFTLPGKGVLTPVASGLVLAMMFFGSTPAASLALVSSLVDGRRRGIGRSSTLANAACHVWLAVALGAIAHRVTNDVSSIDAGPFAVGATAYLVFSGLTFMWLVSAWSTDRLGRRLREQFVPLLAPEVLIALLTGGAAELYSRGDDVALGIVAAAILVFGYVSRQLQLHEARGRDLEQLATAQQVLLGRLVNAEASQRQELARELHDGPLQALLAARQDAAELAASPERADGLERTLSATIRDLRQTMLRLHPGPLRELGFERSVARVAELVADRHGLEVELVIDSLPEPPLEDLAYSAIVELLANVGKHAKARTVNVSTAESGGLLSIAVTDDGCGFDENDRSAALADGHVGLAGLRERVRDRGGRIDFDALEPGSRVTVLLPRMEGVPPA